MSHGQAKSVRPPLHRISCPFNHGSRFDGHGRPPSAPTLGGAAFGASSKRVAKFKAGASSAALRCAIAQSGPLALCNSMGNRSHAVVERGPQLPEPAPAALTAAAMHLRHAGLKTIELALFSGRSELTQPLVWRAQDDRGGLSGTVEGFYC